MNEIKIPQIHVIPFSVNSAEINMATDRYLLGLPGTFLRLYGWSAPTLSFGRQNKGADEIDRDFCREQGIRMVRRISGGKTVLHDRELTYAFISDTEFFPDSVVDSYRIISTILLKAFQRFALISSMSPDKDPDSASTICFRETSAYELTVAGRKLVGSAQYRKRKRFFQHGSILLDIDWPTWKRVWKLHPDSTELEERITSFNTELGHSPGPEDLAETLVDEFGRFFEAKLVNPNLDEQALQEIEELSLKYVWED